MRQEKIREEIQFWRRLIEKWEITRGKPAPERMEEALAMAEVRLNRAIVEGGRQKIRSLFH